MLIPVASVRRPSDAVLDYVEITSPVTVNAITDASADTVIAGNQIVLDGTTRIIVEFYCQCVTIPGGGAANLWISLWDTITDLGHFAEFGSGAVPSVSPCLLRRIFVPSAGSHTYIIKSHSSEDLSCLIKAGTGGVATDLPAYLRVMAVS